MKDFLSETSLPSIVKITLLLILGEKQKRKKQMAKKKKDTDVVRREYIFKAMPWYQRSVREHFNKLLAEYKRNKNKEGKGKESGINPDPPPTKMNRSKKTFLQRYVDMYVCRQTQMQN